MMSSLFTVNFAFQNTCTDITTGIYKASSF